MAQHRSTTEPPGGDSPPRWGTAPDGEQVDLQPLAVEICRRYRSAYPDERERYGAAGSAWCVHDNLYLLAWAFDDVAGHIEMATEVAWLARVLESRDFPLERLAVGLEHGADVVRELLPPGSGLPVGTVLAAAALGVRSHGSFVD